MLTDRITRPQAFAFVLAFWAAIYLPALGSLELKGEEGRRILPAVTMLETGHWIVPSVGGEDYWRKPPLINWLAAGGFAASGGRSETAARLPTALCVLGLGLLCVGALSAWLSPGGALVAAVLALTNIGLMEKGRLAEIEGSYVSICGGAWLLWLGAWRGGAGPWRTWVLPWAFLGLSLLEKGPTGVAFFYVFAAAVLWRAGRLRELLSRPHWLGVALMLVIFAAWAVPCLWMAQTGRVGETWLAQITGRLEVNEGFHFSGWAMNIPRGLQNYLPWVVLLPLLWRRRGEADPGPAPRKVAGNGHAAAHGRGRRWSPEDEAILRGGRLALAGCFLATSLAPGGLPRYTLPLLVPASVLLALVLARDWGAGRLPAWLPVAWARSALAGLCVSLAGALAAVYVAAGHLVWVFAAVVAVGAGMVLRAGRNKKTAARAGQPEPPPARRPLPLLYPAPALALASAAVMGALTFDYALGLVPWLQTQENIRPLAERINRETAGATVCALAPGFLPFLFYLQPLPRYAQTVALVPADARWLLVREKDADAAAKGLAQRNVSAQLVYTARDKNRGKWSLLRLEPPPAGSL